MKKKKLIKRYNELVERYNYLLEEVAELSTENEELNIRLSHEREDKENAISAFVITKAQYDKLIKQAKEIKHERDVYRKNYGELYDVAIAIGRNESSDGAISIKSIDFSDDVTTITWSDGEKTSVKRMKGEKHDTHTAIAYAIAKRVLGTTSIADVVKFYQEDHSKDAKYIRTYKYLSSSNPIKRAKAQKTWEKIPESKRQSIKAMAKRV